MSPRLRALARLLVFALLAFVVFPVKRRWLRAALPGADSTVQYLLDHLIELLAILIYCWIAAAVERRPFSAYGLPPRQAVRARVWQGAAAGLVSLAVLMLALAPMGAIRVEMPPPRALEAAGFGVAYAAVFALLAVREEFLYRGYGLYTLVEAVGFWPAALASTVWFASAHAGNSNENVIGLANVAFFGLLSCLTLRRTGNLWLAIGFHASWNWGQTYLFGVGDSGHPAAPGHLLASTVIPAAPAWLSGGPVGPEGSVLCTGLLALLWIVCLRLLQGLRYPNGAGQTGEARPARRVPRGRGG
jgi:hypothetical protein